MAESEPPLNRKVGPTGLRIVAFVVGDEMRRGRMLEYFLWSLTFNLLVVVELGRYQEGGEGFQGNSGKG